MHKKLVGSDTEGPHESNSMLVEPKLNSAASWLPTANATATVSSSYLYILSSQWIGLRVGCGALLSSLDIACVYLQP